MKRINAENITMMQPNNQINEEAKNTPTSAVRSQNMQRKNTKMYI